MYLYTDIKIIIVIIIYCCVHELRESGSVKNKTFVNPLITDGRNFNCCISLL